jgi:prepilin-type N-terminal cleavage/methylation domain-containing protein
MKRVVSSLYKAYGFTLVEMAIVLVIVGLLLASFLSPLRMQLELRNNSETKTALGEIRDALIGYALSHSALDGRPFLPCPDTDGDGTENRVANLCVLPEGGLPFTDLGLIGTDSWNNRFRYRVTLAFSNSLTGFTLSTPGDITLRDAAGGNVIGSLLPAVIISLGENGAVLPAVGVDQQANVDGNSTYVSKEMSNSQVNPFDDLVVWLSTNTLVNRMVAAERLP